ncbi:hypothetical protein IWX46DRAFT_578967 [Phyllosticta citricarpa]|uniref:Uncharacterized protein n=1 Tax=Phyllosticta citricarpa TaxID=55181 RepID=A0ABR1MP63_9PEZI
MRRTSTHARSQTSRPPISWFSIYVSSTRAGVACHHISRRRPLSPRPFPDFPSASLLHASHRTSSRRHHHHQRGGPRIRATRRRRRRRLRKWLRRRPLPAPRDLHATVTGDCVAASLVESAGSRCDEEDSVTRLAGRHVGLTRAAPVQPVLVAAARRDGASKVAVVEETDRHVRGAVAVASPASRFWSFTAFRHCDRRPGCGDSVLLCAVVCGGSKLTIRLGGGTAGQLPDCGAFKC